MFSIRNSSLLSFNFVLYVNIMKRTYATSDVVLPKVPYLTHNDGTKVPHIGLGTYKNLGDDCENAVKIAIQYGYRSIDTAYFYQNENLVGKAVRDKISEGVVKREDLFITTKLWNTFHDPNLVEHACRLSLRKLDLDYVNLYLMHWPMGYDYEGDDVFVPLDAEENVIMSTFDYIDTWGAMEKLVDLGLTKSIGVSNFNEKQLRRLISNSRIRPAQLQIEFHPRLDQTNLIELCRSHDIRVTAHSPFARPDPKKKSPKFLYDEKMLEIAKSHNKTPAQIVLRYLVERGTIPVPKSVHQERIIENISIFDFELKKEDHQIISEYNTGERASSMEVGMQSLFYPFKDDSK